MSEHDDTRYNDFDRLMARHRGLIKRLCWWHAGGKADAVADLMQEVMLHLWRYRHTLRADAGELQEKAWVWIRCRSVFEHQRRRPRVETVPMEEALHVAAEDTSARDAIDRLAADLTAIEHQVLELVLDGYTDGEIGEVLQVSAAEAKRMHATVIEKMRAKANSPGMTNTGCVGTRRAVSAEDGTAGSGHGTPCPYSTGETTGNGQITGENDN